MRFSSLNITDQITDTVVANQNGLINVIESYNVIGDKFDNYLYPVIIFATSILLGVVFEFVILRSFRRLAQKNKKNGSDIITGSLRYVILVLIIIFGTYAALVVSPLDAKYINALDKILLVLLILTLTIFVKKIVVRLIHQHSDKSDSPFSSPSILANVTKIIIYILGVLIILQSLGISITPIITALGIGGLAVALALQPTLSNLFSGIYMLMSKHVKPGDYVKLDTGEEGYITDITWRHATIKELPGNIIIIPNSKLAEAIVKNYHLPIKVMDKLIEIGVHYDSDLELVERVTIEVAKKMQMGHPGGIKTHEPYIRYHTFGSSSINFRVYLRVTDFFSHIEFQHEFIKRLHKRFAQEGIEIPYPIRNVYMRSPDDHKPPYQDHS